MAGRALYNVERAGDGLFRPYGDADGVVDGLDFGQFRQRFGMMI